MRSLIFVISLVICHATVAQPANEPTGELVRSQMLTALRDAHRRLDFSSIGQDFSFHLAVRGQPMDGRETWSHVIVSSHHRNARVLISASDGLPYSLVGDGYLINLREKHGERLTVVDGGQLVLSIGSDSGDVKGMIMAFRPAANSRIDALFGRLLSVAVQRADRVEYSKQKNALTYNFDDVSMSAAAIFDWRPQAPSALKQWTLFREGDPVAVIDDIRVGAAAEVIASGPVVAELWRASAFDMQSTSLDQIETAASAIWPPSTFERSNAGADHIARVMALAKRWPSRRSLQMGSTENEPAVRLEARQMTIQHTTYNSLARAKELLSSEDAATRRWVVVGLRHHPPQNTDRGTILDMLSMAVRDEAPGVRSAAVNAIADNSVWRWLPDVSLLSLIDESLDRINDPNEIRPLIYALEQVSDGAFKAGDYPRKDGGWPDYDDAAVAWWVVHGPDARRQALAWLARNGEANEGVGRTKASGGR